ncbi:MAG: hypothetical protein HYX90_01760 [Chloroflexi bacterium]|nr:hypothetical protein [Chloroflexota bacterium]
MTTIVLLSTSRSPAGTSGERGSGGNTRSSLVVGRGVGRTVAVAVVFGGVVAMAGGVGLGADVGIGVGDGGVRVGVDVGVRVGVGVGADVALGAGVGDRDGVGFGFGAGGMQPRNATASRPSMMIAFGRRFLVISPPRELIPSRPWRRLCSQRCAVNSSV